MYSVSSNLIFSRPIREKRKTAKVKEAKEGEEMMNHIFTDALI